MQALGAEREAAEDTTAAAESPAHHMRYVSPVCGVSLRDFPEGII
jgi:hypothetical protein